MQLALVDDESVEIVPGSHLRFDTPEEYRIRKADGGSRQRSNDMPNAVRIGLGLGDLLAFNGFTIHRGRYHWDIPRRTLQVTLLRGPALRPDDHANQPYVAYSDYLDGVRSGTRAFLERFFRAYSKTWI